jgi:hypothetical protein
MRRFGYSVVMSMVLAEVDDRSERMTSGRVRLLWGSESVFVFGKEGGGRRQVRNAQQGRI